MTSQKFLLVFPFTPINSYHRKREEIASTKKRKRGELMPKIPKQQHEMRSTGTANKTPNSKQNKSKNSTRKCLKTAQTSTKANRNATSKKNATVKKQQARARSATESKTTSFPKSKNAQRAKRKDDRERKRIEAASNKQSHIKGSGAHDNPPKPKTMKNQNELPDISQEQFDIRERCIANMGKAVVPDVEEIVDECLDKYEKSLLDSKVFVTDCFGTQREATENVIEDMFFSGKKSPYSYAPSKSLVQSVIEDIIERNNPLLHLETEYRYDLASNAMRKASSVLVDEMLTRNFLRSIKQKVADKLDIKRWLSYVSENHKYEFTKKFADAIAKVHAFDLRSYSPPDTERRFILDIGPTNSGKTYSGMVELSKADSGVYLGPLRLLAMEAAEKLNDEMNCPCSLLTGEERHDVLGAKHVSSTVEMLDRDAHYEVAVIDECQMITDPERGYAWASAIASIDAEVIHLCLAPEAESLICSILDGLDESYEICRHERLVPLKMQRKTTKYPNGILKGDALIVFSRKSVQRYANDLAKHGIKASMVYGALPYEVRKEEVRKFMDGETDVVVATDAIGMGLNLPVRRVVFAELEKYDGHEVRELLICEIKQIAGRAGRYGKYDVGYVSVLSGLDRGLVDMALSSDVMQVSDIRVDIPRAMKEIEDMPFARLLRAWQLEEIGAPYVKRDLTQQIALARRIQDLPNSFIADAIEIPFKSGDRFVPLDSMWEKAVRDAYNGFPYSPALLPISPNDSLQRLEDAAKLADLAYGLAKKYGELEDLETIDEHRALICEYMIENLKNNSAQANMCHWCKKKLPKNSKYPMHDRCYREWRANKYGIAAGYY